MSPVFTIIRRPSAQEADPRLPHPQLSLGQQLLVSWMNEEQVCVPTQDSCFSVNMKA